MCGVCTSSLALVIFGLHFSRCSRRLAMKTFGGGNGSFGGRKPLPGGGGFKKQDDGAKGFRRDGKGRSGSVKHKPHNVKYQIRSLERLLRLVSALLLSGRRLHTRRRLLRRRLMH